jgi:hypothetical protein
MISVKRLMTIVAGALALSATYASSASAYPLFLAHPPGGLLLASAGGSQVFTTAAGGITCTALKLLPPGDTTPALRFLSLLVVVDYEKCKAFGLAAIFHPIRYRIDANGLVTQENTALILSLSCTVTLPAERNQSLTAVLFDNNAANRGLLLLWHLGHVTSVGVGAACAYAEESNGIWEGTWHIVMHGGTLRWDP